MGLPRSGTTLVDLVLGAHPKARALGEIEQIGRGDQPADNPAAQPGNHENGRTFTQRWGHRMPVGNTRLTVYPS
ncbi:sulfotransferase [Citreimonas salinaria]|uniref:sulfotransferase n=1 Tax=Citreimonas salinaria TaxID=321339 RepID=UPI0015A5B4E2